ncbi:MAG: chromosome segregation protein SMC [marine benthic group bacterium]|nr:chromosome segregation protein SMC [Gemmatimonadota bacterium]
MKIRSLTLDGFKSFADRTKVEFHGGITAIVGPNGCGKSNISDALRWVLGEQRPSAIRGSRMEEAIFQGTSRRKPIHRAEVSLQLSNEDGVLPVAYPEVEIGRTVLRGGESIYSLNDQTVRLKDIQDMCRDTGLGANAYSIIEGRMIDAILSDRAEERRSLFEEAAEVGRYKDRRRTALRRLEQAEQDLRRLEDVIGEVGSKVRSLARQRGRARRYAELRDRRLELEVAVADSRLREIEGRLLEVDRDLAESRRVQPELTAALATKETEHEALRLALVESERDRSARVTRREQVRGRLEELERHRLLTDERIAAAKNRIEAIRFERESLQERRNALATELDQARSSAGEAEEELESLRSTEVELTAMVEQLRQARGSVEREEADARERLAAVISELGAVGAAGEALRERNRERRRELDRRIAELEGADATTESLAGTLDEQAREASDAEAKRVALESGLGKIRVAERELRERIEELRGRITELEDEQASVSARAGALNSMIGSGRDLPAIVSSLLADPEASVGVRGVLAEFLTVPAGEAAAVESCLGPMLHGVVVDDWEAVLRIRAWLHGQGEGEGIIVLPLDPGPATDPGAAPDGLVNRIEAHGTGANWARALLSGVSAGAREFLPGSGPWVLPDGSGQDSLGAIRLGQPTGGRGVLRRRTELEELSKRSEELDREIKDLRAMREQRAAEAAGLSEEAAETERELEVAATDARRREALRAATADRLDRTRAHRIELESRIADLRRNLGEEDPARELEEEKLAALNADREALEAGLSELRSSLVAATERWESEAASLQQKRLEIARSEARAAAATDRARRAEEARAEIEERIDRLAREREQLAEAIDRGQQDLGGSEESLQALFEERAELDERLRSAQEKLDEDREEVERRESDLRELRQRERAGSERLHELELESTRLRGLRATIRERLEAEWEEEFESLFARTERPESGEPEEWARELESVREKLTTIGPVNLLAAAEHDEEKERFDFLERQKEDLEAARSDLLNSIQRINSAASTAFEEVFGQVRDNFRRIFVTLFEGGEADVWLEDPTDPLDSPIEISASPRGKRTQRIHLLSGGERALTALALLFAIYLAKPSPFCVMDEVDAPLDESNIGRFTAMLERFKGETQFVVITHNARTIEAADHVYGVTMQEPGVSTLVALELKDLPRGQVA